MNHNGRRSFSILAAVGMGWILWLPAAGAGETGLVEPILTRSGATVDRITLQAGLQAFRGADLQEIEEFDGISVGLDLRVPFTKRLQLRLASPVYTEGDARLIERPHQNVDIKGYAGTLELPNAQLEYQFLKQEEHGWNLGLSLGGGAVVQSTDMSNNDLINHSGTMGLGSLRADRPLGSQFTFYANAGARYYADSDDLNPSRGGDTFTLADLSAAVLWHPEAMPVHPGIELAYTGDFGSYNSVLAVPEVVWTPCAYFHLKAGVTVGLNDDGEQFGARFLAAFRF